MSNRSPIQVYVYSCPPANVGQVLDAFEKFDLDNEFVLPTDPAPGSHREASLELGREYLCAEISVGSSTEIAAALPPAAAWKVWEDPAYQHLGQVHLNHPDLGVFVADCDAQGRPVFTSTEVDRLVSRADGDRVQLGHLTGRTWEAAFDHLHQANNGIVLDRGTTAASAPLQAVALSQLASGPARWMPPGAPGHSPSTAHPDR